MIKQNLHTHCVFCDGRNTISEMASKAISLGFDSIGFSSHAYTGLPFDECGIESPEAFEDYISELDRVKAEYGTRLSIFSGIELESRDAYSDNPAIDPRLDYSIGSVHYFWKDGIAYPVDYREKDFLEAADAFGGFRPLIEHYYEEVVRFSNVSKYDITGHLDLVTKFVERTGWDFESRPWYRDAAIYAAERVVENGKIIEVNTGAIARGYRTSPYPAPFILSRLRELDAPVTVTTDCHDAEFLSAGLDDAYAMLEGMGFRRAMILDDSGFSSLSFR
ncbi:MAG: histidinol-phosphatase HisJ family protein [Candidatus Ornithospirochaeta sp.]|nr:histidinol-phosphatase HisJ family protein [Candidatus Ornithospirochaeta sp.]